ncbi:hypothetical protein BD413DRAFT_702681 [Trametes elegans]|nr:hypothetical protein BD413DRAFT_702681 [Trametes elegans]
MDVWPGYCGEHSTAPEKGRSKGKAKDERVEGPWRYPCLEHGSLGAATLRKRYSRYEWSFVEGEYSDYKLVASDAPVEAFPPSRPQPYREPRITELQRAEQGAHFLRTYHPDIDIQAELIREEIKEDIRLSQKLRDEDPYAGNMVEVSSFHASRKNMAYIAFPMGETNRQLNMSPISFQARSRIDIKPSATPVYTFETPIRQIVTSPMCPMRAEAKQVTPTIGVRTSGSTAILQVNLAVNKTTLAVEPVPLVTVRRSDIGNRHAVDMTISSANTSVGFVVNDMGSVYRCSAPEGRPVFELLHAGESSGRPLYHVAVPQVRDTLLYTSEKSAFILDIRCQRQPYLLHAATRPADILTSIECSTDDNIVRLVSSQEILWLDQRNSRKPLLAIKHGRDFDTTLRGHTRPMIGSPLTFLTSRRNSLVTVYDVSGSSDNLIHLHDNPSALPPILRPDGPHLGYALFQPPTLAGLKHVTIFQLSERGGLSMLNLDRASTHAQESSATSRVRMEWSPDVRKLGEDANADQPDMGPLATRAHSTVDLRPAYHRLFIERQEVDLSAQMTAVYDTLERMPSFWQDTDIPVEHSLTMFDIAMRSGSDPTYPSRNDWFTGSTLDSVAGYRTLVQGHIPRDQLVQKAPWHMDIAPFIRRTVPELQEDVQKTLGTLSRYEVADGPDRTASSFRKETDARSQLALDLSLASDVFLPKRPGKDAVTTFDEDMLNISRSTEAMSLGELEPQPVLFSFLRPVRKSTSYRPTEPADDQSPEEPASSGVSPLGVRFLLQEWNVGTDPHQYVYRDPYDAGATPAAFQRPLKASTGKDALPAKEPKVPTQTQRPPAVASSSVAKAPPPMGASQPTLPHKPLAAARSQDALVTPRPRALPSSSQQVDSWTAPPSSQEPRASTQVLPGPHGGRPVPAKKKPVKKRIGGF